MVIEQRNIIIESFIDNGFNPFYNGLGLKNGTYNLINIFKKNKNDGIEEIKKIKYCIYEGYKLNIATYNSKINSYITDHKKIPITISSPIIGNLPIKDENIKQDKPKKIIFSGIALSQNMFKPGMYLFKNSDAISVIDGFTVIDENIISNYP